MSNGANETGAKLTREERLARQLRENLKRRKAQARALADESTDSTLPKSDPNG